MGLRKRDHEIGFSDRKLIGEIVGAQIGIDRQDRHAERIEREPVPEELRPVFQQQRHTGAVAIAGGRIGGAQRLDARERFAIAVAEALRRIGQFGASRRQQERRGGARSRMRQQALIG
jgi:hypothetical protein